MSQRKPRADAKLKNLPAEVQEEMFRRANTGSTVEEILAWVNSEHSVKSSEGAFSGWYSWFVLRKRMEKAKSRAAQATEEFATANPDAKLEDLERLGQMVFTAETIEGGDIGAYVKLMELKLRRAAQEIERSKLATAAKTKIEAGLDALFVEIKGNDRAEKLFAELKEAVANA